MVFCQWEVTRLFNLPLSAGLFGLTFGGTLCVYGLDHLVESHTQTRLSNRHTATPLVHVLCVLLAMGSFSVGLVYWQPSHLFWLGVLALSGCFYLLTTWSIVPYVPGLKELTGAWCFTFLIWGAFSVGQWTLWIAFFLLGFANFLISGLQDQERDQANRVGSLALQNLRLTQIAARAAALSATLLFTWRLGLSPFTLCAGLHLVLPYQSRTSIDTGFIPLLLTPFF